MAATRPNVRITFHDDGEEMVQPASPVTTVAPFGRWLFGAIVLAALAAAVVIPSLNGEWLPRDERNVVDNTALRAWAGIKLIWLKSWLMPQVQPLSYSAYLVEYRLFRAEPAGYHFVNLLLHVSCTLLLWTLLRKIHAPLALLCAALFAVHPLNVATAAWVSQQKLLWCGVFYLSALLVYLRYVGVNAPPELDDPDAPLPPRLPSAKWLLYVIAIVLLMLALASHPMAVTFAAVVPVMIWWRRERLTRADVRSLVLPATLCALAAAAVLMKESRALGDAGDLPNVAQRVQLFGVAVWMNLWRVIAPVRLQFVYERWPIDARSVAGYLPTLAVIAALAGLWSARRRIGRGAFAAGLLYVALSLPGSGIVNHEWMRESYLADHLQYFATAVPIVAIVWAASAWAMRAARPARLAAGFTGVAIVAVLTVAGTLRAANYQTPRKLWNSTLAAAGRDTVAVCNGLATEALKRGDTNAAYQYAVRALAVDAENVEASLAIAEVYLRRNELDRVIAQYQQILRRYPRHDAAQFALADAIKLQGDSVAAMREFRALLERNPRFTRAWNNLGELHASRGEMPQAIECYEWAIDCDPRFIPARLNVAYVYYNVGELEKCVLALNTVIQIDPGNFEGYMSAGAVLGTLARGEKNLIVRKEAFDLSASYFRAAMSLNPKSPEAFANYGKMQAMRSQLEPRERALLLLGDAIASFRRAQALRPDYADAAELERMALRDREHRQSQLESQRGADAVPSTRP